MSKKTNKKADKKAAKKAAKEAYKKKLRIKEADEKVFDVFCTMQMVIDALDHLSEEAEPENVPECAYACAELLRVQRDKLEEANNLLSPL